MKSGEDHVVAFEDDQEAQVYQPQTALETKREKGRDPLVVSVCAISRVAANPPLFQTAPLLSTPSLSQLPSPSCNGMPLYSMCTRSCAHGKRERKAEFIFHRKPNAISACHWVISKPSDSRIAAMPVE